MGTVDIEKLKEIFAATNKELLAIEQRFEQLSQLARQIEQEQSQLRLKAQHLAGQLEVLRQVLPEEEQQKIIEDLRKELEANNNQNAEVAQSEVGPQPVEDS